LTHILALDQGTTSSRAIVFDGGWNVLGSAQAPVRCEYPKPGWVEQDARQLWQTQRKTAAEAVLASGLRWDQIHAIGIANQRETVVVWDRSTGEPLAPAIVWQDRRTASACQGLRERGAEETISARTGLVIDPYFSATKIGWLLENTPGLRAKADRGQALVGTVESWLVWNLTGGRSHITDVTNASRTMLMDLSTHEWSDELLEMFGVPRQALPEIVPSWGEIANAASEVFGVRTPIAGLAGDQQSALYGQGCRSVGEAKNTYGTGCFLLVHVGEKPVASKHRLLSTTAASGEREPGYALEGAVFTAGAAVQWLRDGLGLIAAAGDVESLASTVDDSGGVVVVPAFTGLGAPHWDAEARGAILGLTRGSTGAHVARATLEAICHQTADVVEAMNADTGEPVRSLRVDGGACANDLLMQMQADLLGVTIRRPSCLESTALGAAMLAARGAGLETELGGPSIEREFEPARGESWRAGARGAWSEAVGRVRS